MLSRLRVGQPVRLLRAISGGYNVEVLNDDYVKSFKGADANYIPEKIIQVSRDFIVVDKGRKFKQAISAYAIHVINELPEAVPGAT
jgi:hypothetical protein